MDVNQTQDVFAADVQYQTVGGSGPTGAAVAVAAVIGLIVAGLGLIVFAWRGRPARPASSARR